MTHLKVAVRIRPLSQRETKTNSLSVVDVQNQNVIAVTNLKVPEQNAGDSRERIKRFTFDYCFHPDSTQDEVFEVIGREIEKAIKKRFHSCVLAYGQSSSGKTHTMMGTPESPGLTPNLCRNIFKYLQEYKDEEQMKIKTEISYLEIYNEKVRDLLVSDGIPAASKANSLRVREHPKKGPYVQGLTHRAVNDPENLLHCLKIGNANRRVSATLTNPHSSRSHSVFTILCGEGIQLHLIDLAGSERAGNKLHNISTLKEGANINKSLVALGNVISTLAEQSSRNLKDHRKRFVPYRDSILTWLLKDTLGGNSKTVMIATVSPSNTCYNETINTLRFGQRAKKIISYPVVNEDPKERTIRELRTEITRLKELLALHQESKNIISSSPISFLNQDISNANEEIKLQEENSRKDLCNSSDSTSVTSFNNCKPSERLCTKSEKLWPVMNVTSEIEEKSKIPVPKIRRTFSVDHGKMEVKTEKVKPKNHYGSHELIPNNNAKEKPIKRTSQPSINLRKSSIDRSTSKSLQKSVLIRKTHENVPKKSETGVVTEVRGPKVDPSKKLNQFGKPRSHIVAAVTDRLYGKTKKKEVGTETDRIKSPNEDVPKELTICSNARLRLRDLTQQALRIHRRRNIDTQTDLFPVLRVKETSTDSTDLKITLAEVKNVHTDTIKIETKEAGTACCFIENFDDHLQDYKNAFVVTRSCGTQSTEDLLGESSKPRDHPQHSGISFTKYLQNNNVNKEPTFQIVNPCTANPIYTSSVNISVSHNYISKRPSDYRAPDAVSDDSLDEQDQSNNVCFPTPDIISNHNSLEHGNTNISHEQNANLQDKHAVTDATQETYTTTDKFINIETPYLRVAHSSIQTTAKERLEIIDIPIIYAPQICLTESKEERCGPFWNTIPPCEAVEPQIVNQNGVTHCAVVNEPVVLKSIMKIQETKLQQVNNKDDLKKSIQSCERIAPSIEDQNEDIQCGAINEPVVLNPIMKIQEITSQRVSSKDNLKEAMPLCERVTPQAANQNEACAVFDEPVILKSSRKTQASNPQRINSKDNFKESLIIIGDNLAKTSKPGEENDKKVRFSKSKREQERIFKAMSKFMEEASNLMTNLSLAASRLQAEQSFDLEVTVNDIHGLVDSTKSSTLLHDCQSQTCILHEASSQTSPKQSLDAGCYTEPVFQLPLNKYDELVEESCARLERCVNKIEQQTYGKHRSQDRCSVQTSNPSTWNAVDDSSLESNVTFSDYGSLPRQRKKKGQGCSPSAYLKQLTSMRKQIIESSRSSDDLVGQEELKF